MKFIALLLVALLTACGDTTPEPAPAVAPLPEIGVDVGGFSPSGGGYMRTFTVDGTNCIWVGRYTTSALSCDWK